MPSTTEILEKLFASIQKTTQFGAGMFQLLLLHEFRHWRAHVDGMPDAAHLDGPARDRAAARTAVDIATRFFHDEHRAELEAARDGLVEQLLRVAGESEKPTAGWLN